MEETSNTTWCFGTENYTLYALEVFSLKN